MSLWNDLKNKLDETISRIEELTSAKESVENLLIDLEALDLPDGIEGSHHAEMELNDTLSSIEEELQELQGKVAHL